ncbi:MAG TPA: cupin domain-containing protein [Anaerolineales bacterium]|nr:cupin domain-containing protein [Anaerolineales bacterium]
MPSRHIVRTADQEDFQVPKAFEALSKGFRRWCIVDGEAGSVHQEFSICELDPGGTVDAHIHTFEESIYILEGNLICQTGDGTYSLQPGDYGVIHVSSPHAFRNDGNVRVRWAEMLAPQPRLDGDGDVYPVDALPRTDSILIDARDPRTRSFGHISPENMEAKKQTQDTLAVSASMRTALLVYSGITVKMMVDSDLGAQLSTMFMVQYEPAGVAGAHDHPLEETYFILEGEVYGWFDGQKYHLKPGDCAWAGVGCIHEFRNATDGIVRWLETQAPQPPRRHSYRFRRDWKYLEEKLGKGEHPHG